MYINKNKLSHLLKPYHYRDEQFLEIEKKHLFEPSWHLLAATDEIPNHGDFLTLDFFGKPLLLRNCNGEFHTFLNVCGHRHCKLTDQKQGNAPTIKCQYHGWEYKPCGSTGKIPDAQCFKPFDRENTHLEKFRTTVCGNLIYIALSEAAPPFEEYIGHHKEVIEEWFGDKGDYHFGCRMTYDIDSNWKVSAENTLESYHVPHVHKKTIGDHPDEEDQEHEIGTYYSSLYTTEPKTINRTFQDILMGMLGYPPSHDYTHHFIYPNSIMLGLDPMTMTQTYIPTSPSTHRWEGLVFVRSAKSPLRKIFQLISDPIIKYGTKKVVIEDIHLFGEVQKGLEVSNHPGVVGTIEERIFAYQEYLLAKCEGRDEKISDAWLRKPDEFKATRKSA